MTIYKFADNSKEIIEEKFMALRAGLAEATKEKVDEFVYHVDKEGRISINLKQNDIEGFIKEKAYLNRHELEERTSKSSLAPPKETLNGKTGEYLSRKQVFEEYFKDGKEFKYGALNAGGFGADRFGPYCLVCQAEYPEEEKDVVYLMNDSANAYVKGGIVIEDKLKEEIAIHSSRCELAALKHSDNVEEGAEFARQICGEEDFIEVIFKGSLGFTNIQEVRVEKTVFTGNVQTIVNSMLGTLDAKSSVAANLATWVLDSLAEAGIPIIVEDA